MLIRGFVKAVAELLGDRVPSYRRHPRRWGAMGLDLSRTEIQSLEQRLVLAAPVLGAEVATYELSIEDISSGGAVHLIDHVLYYLGSLPSGAPYAATLDFYPSRLGAVSSIVFSGTGQLTGVFDDAGILRFVGGSDSPGSGADFTTWTVGGDVSRIVDFENSQAFATNTRGRTVGIVNSVAEGFVAYLDNGADQLTVLPGIAGYFLGGQAITDDDQFIGGSGFDSLNNFRVVTYKLVNDSYQIYRDSYQTVAGFDAFSMKFVESPSGVFVLASYYDETFVQKVAMFTIDGEEVVADVGDGSVTGAVSVGGNIYVATSGGTITAISPTYETRTYAVDQLFGSTSFSFDGGSLFVSPTGDLGVVAKNGPKTVVKTFEVPRDATLPPVAGSSIVVPELVAGGAGTISWAPVAGATGYELVFGQNGVVARTASVTTASYAVPASFRAGSYALTIRATVGETLGPLSSEVNVVVKPQAVVISTLTGLPEVANSASVVRWQAGPDATSHSVTVRQASAPTNAAPVFSGTTQTNSISLPTGLAANVYELTIVARSGVILSRETKATFTVKQGSVNAASIAGFGAHPGAQTVTWQAVAGAAVAGVTRHEVQVTELGSSTPLVARIVTTNAVSFTLAKTGNYRFSLRVLGSPAATHGSWVPKNFVLVLPVVPVASIQLSQTIAGVATNVAFGRVAGAMKYDLWVYSFQTQQFVLKTSLTAISHRLAAGLSAGRYRLFVRGVDDAGRAAAWAWRDVSIVPLAQVTGVAVSGLGSANVAGSVAWRAVSGAVGYEVLITGAGNREVRRVSVSGLAYALSSGLAAG
jgi:hypothetical protein